MIFIVKVTDASQEWSVCDGDVPSRQEWKVIDH